MKLAEIAENNELLEIGRKAIEDLLVKLRDSRIFVLRNNGLVIRERDGKESSDIRMGSEDALRIGLRAISEHLGCDSFLGKKKLTKFIYLLLVDYLTFGDMEFLLKESAGDTLFPNEIIENIQN